MRALARQARIVDQIADAFGDAWDVREYRPTAHGFDVAFGWPADQLRGAGQAGGPRVILTEDLVIYLAAHRSRPKDIRLPIGRTTLKRLRRTLGHHWQIDRAAWWEARTDDLADLTIEQFCSRHGVSAGAVVNARHALFGPALRPAGWWRDAEVAALILSNRPRAEIADQLGVSIGSIGRLRWALKPSPPTESRTTTRKGAPRQRQHISPATRAEVERLSWGFVPPAKIAELLNVNPAAVYTIRSRAGITMAALREKARKEDANNA